MINDRNLLVGTGPSRGAFSVVEIVVAVAVVGSLAALTLPAIQAVREAARGGVCRNRLREVALATLQFEAAAGALPPARLVAVGDETYARVGSATWLVRIMPFIGHAAIYDAWDATVAADAQPETVRSAIVTEYLCPTRRGGDQAVTRPTQSLDRQAACGCLVPGRFIAGGAVVDFGGNHGTPMDADRPIPLGAAGPSTGTIVSSEYLPGTARWRHRVRIRDISDGTSRTLLIGEMHVPRGRLCEPPENGPAYDGTDFFSMSRLGGLGIPLMDGPDDDGVGTGLFAFGSWHSGACHVAFADGRIARLSTAITPEVLARICHRRDGHATGHGSLE